MTITADQIVMDAEVYLGDWAHSIQAAKRNADAKATFYFADDDEIRPLTLHQTRVGQGKKTPGKRFRMVLIEVDGAGPAASPDPSAPAPRYGQHARDLRLSSFFRTPDVWRVLGTDEAFREWVTYQPSIVNGGFGEYDAAGDGRNVACHVRRASNSGTAFKPAYACVPMTDSEHRLLQHQHGEEAARQRAAESGSRTAAQMEGKAWFDHQRMATVTAWGWHCVKAMFGAESMADVAPEDLFEWANAEGVAGYLPKCYRQSPAAIGGDDE